MKKILIIVAHPDIENSRLNKSVIKSIGKQEYITTNYLYNEYPDFKIDVKREQSLLLNHDLIILQHPIYWYSAPALIKEWFDVVLTRGFAYGTNGNALSGKWLMNSVTTGGNREEYSNQGRIRFTINQFLYPINQSAHLCNMNYLPPFVIHKSRIISDHELIAQGENFKELLIAIRDDIIDPSVLNKFEYLNDYFYN